MGKLRTSALLLLLAPLPSARGEPLFAVSDDRQAYDAATDSLLFHVVFNRELDIRAGTAGDDFGYYLGWDHGDPRALINPEFLYSTFERGHEGWLTIRWNGGLLAAVPMEVDGASVSFSLPWWTLMVPYSGPIPNMTPYSLAAFVDGRLQYPVRPGILGVGMALPEPGSIVIAGLGAVGLLGYGMVRWTRRR